MLLEYNPSLGATILDMVLNTYLSLDLLPKFVKDNNLNSLDLVCAGNEVYVYDTDFIDNEFMSDDIKRNGYKFTTGSVHIPNASFNDSQDPIGYLLAENSNILKAEDNAFLIHGN